MKALFGKINFILTKQEKYKLSVLFVGTVILAVLETFGIGIIIPIMNLFINQEKIHTSKMLRWIYQSIGAPGVTAFLIIMIVTAMILFIFKSVYSIFIFSRQRNIVNNINIRLTTNLLISYLDKPYTFHLENNSAVLFRNITTEVSHFCDSFLYSTVMISTEIIVMFAIFCLLICIYPFITLSLTSILAAIMIFMNFFLKKRIKIYSSQRIEASSQVHKFGLEALQAVKEIKVYNAQDFFSTRYSNAAKKYGNGYVKFNVISEMPRYILEMVLWAFVLLTLLISIYMHIPSYALIPMMTALGLAALRILPSINRIYMHINIIKYYSSGVDVIYNILKKDVSKESPKKVPAAWIEAAQDSQVIRLENVEFGYETTPAPLFTGLSLVIPGHKIIALTGETGAGKSTLADIIMGLLDPSRGALYYGRSVITPENVSEYRRKISYVPQNVFLIDDTLEANIAFGVSHDKVGYEQLNRVIKMAQLESFVDSLPMGTKTTVGEKGVRLSGGQRQRVAIARALYRDPKILIMDEATSALDGYTEAELNNSMKNLSDNLTIIIIAHRAATIKSADIIYVMERGKIVGKGKFDELLESSTVFKRIINQKASYDE